MGDFGGVIGLFEALLGAAGVLDASPGPLGRGGGSTRRNKGYDGKFWAT